MVGVPHSPMPAPSLRARLMPKFRSISLLLAAASLETTSPMPGPYDVRAERSHPGNAS